MANEYVVNKSDLTTVANAIRTKAGTSGSLVFPDGFASAISNLPTRVNCKIYRVTVPTAVAEQFVTFVTGDPDVSAHYADEHAMVTVRKITNNSSNGTAIIVHTNHQFPIAYGAYMNYNGTLNAASTITANMQGTSSGTPFVNCTASGDIKVYARRTQNNFGGAEYIVTFSW